MIDKMINNSSKISLNYDLIKNGVKKNIYRSPSPKKEKVKVLFALICFILIPVFVIFLIIHLVNIGGNLVDRCSYGREKIQREFLSGFAENDIIELDYAIGQDLYWYHEEVHQYARFKTFDTEFSDYYYIEYENGKIKEYPNDQFIDVEHKYKNSEDFFRDVFAININIRDYDMDIEYKNKLTNPQKSIRVICELKGENQLTLNFKYKNEIVIINDVVIEYVYNLNDDDKKTLHIEIKFNYNGEDYIIYGRKYS